MIQRLNCYNLYQLRIVLQHKEGMVMAFVIPFLTVDKVQKSCSQRKCAVCRIFLL